MIEISAMVHCVTGLAAMNSGRYQDAVDQFTEALEINPMHYESACNLGNVLTKMGQYAKAMSVLNLTISTWPERVGAWTNMGLAHWARGDWRGAAAIFRHALELEPLNANLHRNLGLVLLALHEYPEGWLHNDYRFAADQVRLGGGSLPIWDGKPLDGNLLVFAEQGLGDEILYASMIPDLLKRQAAVTWQCDKRLMPLLERSFPGVHFIKRGMAYVCAAQIPAGTLGGWFRQTDADFPQQPYLFADPVRRHIPKVGHGPLVVGISYRSTNPDFGAAKSIPLDDIHAALDGLDILLVNLQYGDESEYGVDLANDLDGVASLIRQCDLVITVSNSVAHMAAAIGRPTWVMVSSGGGKLWYWGSREYTTTPWYPNTRLFKQGEGGWNPVLAEVRGELVAVLEARGVAQCIQHRNLPGESGPDVTPPEG